MNRLNLCSYVFILTNYPNKLERHHKVLFIAAVRFKTSKFPLIHYTESEFVIISVHGYGLHENKQNPTFCHSVSQVSKKKKKKKKKIFSHEAFFILDYKIMT